MTDATVRLLDFNQYRETVSSVDKLGDDDETHFFVVGSHAPQRTWGDLFDEWLSLVGFSAVRDYALKHDHDTQAFDEDGDVIHDFGEDDVDEFVEDEAPGMFHDTPEIDASDGVKRIGDVAFPAYGFDDETSTDELENADTTLITTTIFPESAVRPEHPAVLSVDDMLHTVDAVVDAADADDPVAVVGAHSPQGNFSIQNDGGVHRFSDSIYTANAFQNATGISSISQGIGSLYGTIFVDRDSLSEQANQLVDGEIDELSPDDAGGESDDQGATSEVEA